MNSKEVGFSVCLLLVCLFLFFWNPDWSCCLMLFYSQDIGKKLLNSPVPASSSQQRGTQAHFLGSYPRLQLHDTSLDFSLMWKHLAQHLAKGKSEILERSQSISQICNSTLMPVQNQWAPADIRVSALLPCNQPSSQAVNILKPCTFYLAGLLTAVGFI